jgi:hypothetical protein
VHYSSSWTARCSSVINHPSDLNFPPHIQHPYLGGGGVICVFCGLVLNSSDLKPDNILFRLPVDHKRDHILNDIDQPGKVLFLYCNFERFTVY